MYSENRKQGIYWRTWSICFENDQLEIEGKTKHSNEPLNHYCEYLNYHAVIFLKQETPLDRMSMKKDLKDFVADAMNYLNYVTDSLNEIEVDIKIA